MPPTTTPSTGVTYDPERPWTLHPQVSLRPESFGALAYHFGTRRLSFLKSRTLLTVVESLAAQPSGADACRAAGVTDDELASYELALGTLAESGMICERVA
jgi:putative mycofactocin binding protein MftB